MVQIIPNALEAELVRSEQDPRPVVLMTCGIAGSGKSTLAKAVVAAHPSFTRISIDEIIYFRHGLYGIDYPPSQHAAFEAEADEDYDTRFRLLLHAGKDIVCDRSFYDRNDRETFRRMIKDAGARCVLVYFKAERDVLWRRICQRRAKGVDANCALDISEELLDRYVSGFDEPTDEGEIVINVG